ncbi:MAG TPA: MYG1 family protein [Candidatus Paceibacterota bacterium]
MIKLVTHDGSFHTDDIFAAATLSIMLESKGEVFEIIRTRDEEIIKNGDYIFDIGGIYDADKNRFDHHQVGGAGKRSGEGEIEYASIGLVWKKFSAELCGGTKAADLIDRKLIAPIDAWDNGMNLVTNNYKEVSPYFLQHVFFTMEPTWREEDLNINDMFLKSVAIAKEVLLREIIQAKDAILAEEAVLEIYKNTKDKEIIILDKNYPCQYVLNEFSEPLFIVYPRKTNGWWGAKAVRNDPKSFKNRKDFPTAWGGVREEELQKITGVSDAVFCHKGLYMVVSKTKEGAIKLAQIALES